MVGFAAHDGAVRPLSEGFLPDCLEQRAVDDGRLLARQDLIFVFDLADVEVIAEQVVKRAAAERDTAFRTSPTYSSKIGAISAWLRKGEIEATEMSCGDWQPNRLRQSLDKLRVLSKAKKPAYF